MHVHELMTQPVFSCRVHDTTNAAAQIMWEHDCGVVPVVDDEGRLAGMITDRDICMAAYFQGLALQEIPVDAVMSRDLCTCRPDDDVLDAEHKMSEWQVHRLPVVDDRGAPIGMLSLSDVARYVKRPDGALKQRDGQELAATVAAISEKRRDVREPIRVNES